LSYRNPSYLKVPMDISNYLTSTCMFSCRLFIMAN